MRLPALADTTSLVANRRKEPDLEGTLCDDMTPTPHDLSPPVEAREPWLSRRMVPLYLLGLASVGVLVADAFVLRDTLTERAKTEETPAVAAVASQVTSSLAGQDLPAHLRDGNTDDPPVEPPDPEEPPAPNEKPKKPKNGGKPPPKAKNQSVEQATASSCSTDSVNGLSRQIVAETRCLDPHRFTQVPRRKNLVTSGNVFLYLEAPARDRLLEVLDANPKRTMTINSAFRTIVQQYMLDRWARTGRCGIKLAAHPGESNHETGLALDVREPGTWKAALEAHGFRWMGSSDPVHFDYQGGSGRGGVDIIAFQRLWNRNHPEDRIAENGAYSEQVASRIKKSPALGFPQGPVCTAK